jgi:hypothetical protein
MPMPRKVVVVLESDDNLAKVLRLYFQGTDWEMHFFPALRSSLQSARELHPSVLLVGASVNEGDLLGFTRAVAEDDSLKALPAVLMATSGEQSELFADGATETALAKYSMRACITKPFIRNDLLRVLKALPAGKPAPLPTAMRKTWLDNGPLVFAYLVITAVVAGVLTVVLGGIMPNAQADPFHLFGPLWLCGMLFPAFCLAHPGGKTGLAWALLSWIAGGTWILIAIVFGGNWAGRVILTILAVHFTWSVVRRKAARERASTGGSDPPNPPTQPTGSAGG